MTSNNVLPATLSALLRNYSVAEGIQMAEQQVKMHPTKALHRHSLFQLLCVIGNWSRAAATNPTVRPTGCKLYPRSAGIWGVDSL